MKSITISATVLVEDGYDLKQMVAKEINENKGNITIDDIMEYLERNLIPARSNVKGILVKGGDTDGCFIDHFDDESL